MILKSSGPLLGGLPLIKDVHAKFSNIDFFSEILPLKDDELVMSPHSRDMTRHDMKCKIIWGVTDFVSERTCPEKYLNLSKSGFVSEEGYSGCKSQNIAIRTLRGNIL